MCLWMGLVLRSFRCGGGVSRGAVSCVGGGGAIGLLLVLVLVRTVMMVLCS